MTENLSINSISQNLSLIVNSECQKMLKQISEKFNINEEELKVFLPKTDKKVVFRKKRKKKPVPNGCQCLARKQDGFQCSRRKRDDVNFCGKHIKNRPYGRIDDFKIGTKMLGKQDSEKYVQVKETTIEDTKYLLDKNNILFNPDSYKIIGKLTPEGIIKIN